MVWPPCAYVLPRVILGCVVSLKQHQSTKDSGLRVRCMKCRARKFVAPLKEEHGFGPSAVEAFFGSWLPMDGGGDANRQVRQKLSVAQQKAFPDASVSHATSEMVIPRATCEVDSYPFHGFCSFAPCAPCWLLETHEFYC